MFLLLVVLVGFISNRQVSQLIIQGNNRQTVENIANDGNSSLLQQRRVAKVDAILRYSGVCGYVVIIVLGFYELELNI